MDKIDLIPVKELTDKRFFIPRYQRGYRWTQQQVIELLEDIKDFIENGAKGIYCIQPLVVKGRTKPGALKNIGQLFKDGTMPNIEDIQKELQVEKWDVIDGQQRLTTIKILLSYLQKDNNESIYELQYETRPGSKDFLDKIALEEYNNADSNIDFYYMDKSYKTIKKWFEGYEDREKFLSILRNKVQFIWYETHEKDPIKVFTRLNIGKIALTDSELIKALFLNQSNFLSENKDLVRMQQIEIANEWDRIEYTLQNNEFWLFIQNETSSRRPTRIDFIYDLIVELDSFQLGDILEEEYNEKIGHDEHRTFRYFYEYFKANKKDIDAEWLRQTWLKVKNFFQIFEEWFNDLELYHYVGYLINLDRDYKERKTIKTLIRDWAGKKEGSEQNSGINGLKRNGIAISKIASEEEPVPGAKEKMPKERFKAKLKEHIKDKLVNCANLTQQYEIDIPNSKDKKYPQKTTVRPILLLHNIQTIISQHNSLKSNTKYSQGIFVRFPFHLFKIEGWDVEHIDSNTTNDLTDFDSQLEYLNSCLLELEPENQADYQKELEDFLKLEESDEKRDRVFQKLVEFFPYESELDNKQKNQLMNFTLLDSSTNRSYGNAIFPAKRRIIKSKDQGKVLSVPQIKDGKLVKEPTVKATSTFIPICTKQVFMKYYSDDISNCRQYTLKDAKAYLQDINDVLSNAGFIIDQSEDINALYEQ